MVLSNIFLMLLMDWIKAKVCTHVAMESTGVYRTREVNRLQKMLEGANIKIASVVSDVLGVSPRAMLEGLLEDPVDPEVLDQLARGRMKNKTKNLERALTGLMGSPAADACHSA